MIKKILKIFSTIQNSSLSCSLFIGSGFSLEKMPSFEVAAKKVLRDFNISQSSRQAEILFIFGEINHKSAAILKFHYAQLNSPQFVIHIHKYRQNQAVSYAQIEHLNHVIPLHLHVECEFLDQNAIQTIIKHIQHRLQQPELNSNPNPKKSTQKKIHPAKVASEIPIQEIAQNIVNQHGPSQIGHLYQMTRRRLGIQKFIQYKYENFNEWAQIKAHNLLSLCRFYRHDKDTALNLLVDLTAMQSLQDPTFLEVTYFFRSTIMPYKIQLSVQIPIKDAILPSISTIYPAANWLERELYDLFGIHFEGHPNLKRLLLYPGFMGHPLLKSYPSHRAQPLVPIKAQKIWTQKITIRRAHEKTL